MNVDFHFFLKIAAPILVMSACTPAALEKDVDQKLSQEKQVKTNADLIAETNTLIQNAKGIDNDQKAKLIVLRNLSRKQLEENWQNSLKLRSVLIKDLVQNDYKENEVELIKHKLKDLESKRLSIMFDAVNEANTIMGRQAHLNSDVMQDFIRLERD